MADEAGDSELEAEMGQPTKPAIRLLDNPVGSDPRLEAVTRHGKLTREHPVGAEIAGNTRAALDQPAIVLDRSEHGREMQ
jgi:hypothetical protein